MMTTLNPRNIAASLNHKGRPQFVRRYARLNTAMPRAMHILIDQGEPGDTVDFYHIDTGIYLGFLKVHAGGRVTGQFIKD